MNRVSDPMAHILLSRKVQSTMSLSCIYVKWNINTFQPQALHKTSGNRYNQVRGLHHIYQLSCRTPMKYLGLWLFVCNKHTHMHDLHDYGRTPNSKVSVSVLPNQIEPPTWTNSGHNTKVNLTTHFPCSYSAHWKQSLNLLFRTWPLRIQASKTPYNGKN